MPEHCEIGKILTAALLAAAVMPGHTPSTVQVVRRYDAPEATQAVAIDAEFFYAIGSAVVAKYGKRTGQRVARWEGKRGGPVAHLNSGIVIGDELLCAHSNYPDTPMVSSLEVFDTKRMTHIRSMPLPSGFGSATWVEQIEGTWWVAFAHYAGRGGEPGKGPGATRLVQFDRDWRQRSAWSFPDAVVARWDGMSSSGGARVNDRRFLTTGHHARELYVVELPASGTQLALGEIVPIESEGQGIAFDRTAGLLYSIQRRTRQVIVSKFVGQ